MIGDWSNHNGDDPTPADQAEEVSWGLMAEIENWDSLRRGYLDPAPEEEPDPEEIEP